MADQLTTETLRLALGREFRAAVEAVVGRPLAAGDGTAPSGPGWGTPLTITGALDGQLTAWVDQAGVVAIARAMMGIADTPDPGVAADMLTQLWAQAAAATMLLDECQGVTLAAEPAAAGMMPAADAGVVMRSGPEELATLVFTGTVTRGNTELTSAAGRGSAGRGAYPGNLAALLDIDLPLVVRFARTEMSLRALSQLGPGSMVDMGRSPDAPVQLLIGSQVVAEGEVVVVAGNYGVRITSLASPAERLRAMEL